MTAMRMCGDAFGPPMFNPPPSRGEMRTRLSFLCDSGVPPEVVEIVVQYAATTHLVFLVRGNGRRNEILRLDELATDHLLEAGDRPTIGWIQRLPAFPTALRLNPAGVAVWGNTAFVLSKAARSLLWFSPPKLIVNQIPFDSRVSWVDYAALAAGEDTVWVCGGTQSLASSPNSGHPTAVIRAHPHNARKAVPKMDDTQQHQNAEQNHHHVEGWVEAGLLPYGLQEHTVTYVQHRFQQNPSSIDSKDRVHGVHGMLVLVGGHAFSPTRNKDGLFDEYGPTSKCWCTTTNNDGTITKWSPLPPLKCGTSGHTATVFGRRLFIAGGSVSEERAHSPQTNAGVSVLDLDDPESDWSDLGSLPPIALYRRWSLVEANDQLFAVPSRTDESDSTKDLPHGRLPFFRVTSLKGPSSGVAVSGHAILIPPFIGGTFFSLPL